MFINIFKKNFIFPIEDLIEIKKIDLASENPVIQLRLKFMLIIVFIVIIYFILINN
jgi:hypothetical protein